MQVKKTQDSDTNVTLTIVAGEAELSLVKERVLGRLAAQVKLAGFREGKAPLNLVEKNLDPAKLQAEFLDEALSSMYAQTVQQEGLRPVAKPEVSLKKFVPFTQLEFEISLQVLGEIKLPDYTKFKKTLPPVNITAKDIQEVLNSLKVRLADKKEVTRAAKATDEVIIDFAGTDAKGQPVQGAESKDYPLMLGSKNFIPGFEENIIGLPAGADKSFTLTFPKDYHVKALAGKKVTFNVTVKKVQELLEPKLDDAFAQKAGPFKTLEQLKSDIKKELTQERQAEAQRTLENELIQELVEKSKLHAPQALIDGQAEAVLRDLQQNITYRGLTYKEYLESEGKTEEEYRTEMLLPEAEKRVKAGLVLSEVAEAENIRVTNEELDARIAQYRAQYQDAAMQAELAKPEARRDIGSRILTEKTVAKLVAYATK